MNNDKAKAILESIPNAIIVTGNTAQIEYFNLAASPLFQYFQEDVEGWDLEKLIPDLDIISDEGVMDRKIIYWVNESHLKGERSDGSLFPIEITVGEITLDKKSFWVFSIRDITVRLAIEAEVAKARERLVQNERLSALGGMVAGVAHEINTPLGISITASSHLEIVTNNLEKDYKSGQLKRSAISHFFEESKEAMKILNSNLLRAAELIRSFKLVSVDQSSEEKRIFDLKDYLHEILLSLKPQLKKSSIQLTVECEEGLILNTYPGAMAQIVTNFIMNSLIHGFNKKHEGNIFIKAFKKKSHFVLDYRDNGKGIEEADLKRIFDPFFTTNRGEGGSGLGLHIVHNLITQTLGGEVTCQSELNQGVHFILEIPINIE